MRADVMATDVSHADMEMNSVPAEMNGGLWDSLLDVQYLSSQTYECPQAVHCAFPTAGTEFATVNLCWRHRDGSGIFSTATRLIPRRDLISVARNTDFTHNTGKNNYKKCETKS
jgi:hypothetical protein